MAGNPSRRDFLRWSAAGGCMALGSIAFGDVTGGATELVRLDLQLPKWDADGFRVGLIADTHVNTPEACHRARAAIQRVVDEKPDVIIVAGDFVSKSAKFALDYIHEAYDPTRGATCPTIGVMGNHDYFAAHPERVMKTVRDCGIQLLRNERVDVQGVAIVGLDDAIMGLHRPDMLLDERLPTSVLSILHEPDYADEMPGLVSLQLSGHSHGGQICWPGGIPIETRIGARNYTAGFYPEAKVPLYVSRGVGTTGYDLRLFCRPEITILTLRGAS